MRDNRSHTNARSLRWLISLSLLVFGVRGVSAQDVGVSIRVTTQSPVVGQSVTLFVDVKNAKPDTAPMIPEIDGLVTSYGGESSNSISSIQIVNGKRQQSETTSTRYSYIITPLAPGTYKIPSLTFTVGGNDYPTQEFTLNVSMPSENPDYQIVLASDASSAIVGQRVPMTLTWYASSGIVQQPLPTFVMLAKDTELTSAATTPTPLSREKSAGSIQVLYNGERITIEAEQVAHRGRTFYALRMPIIVLAQSAGTHTIGPVTCSFVVSDGGFFGSDRSVVIASNELTLDVGELPEVGKPSNYTGLVGRYSIEAQVDQTSVHVGDPIKLTLRVRGDDPMPRQIAPRLEDMTDFARNFKLSPNGWDEAFNNPPGVRIYTTTIRAANDSVTEIPSIELPFFDVDTGAYRVARSQPVRIDVQESAIVTLNDAVRLQPTPDEGAPTNPAKIMEKERLSSERVALGANVYDERTLTHSLPAVLPFAWSSCTMPTVAMVIAGPPVASIAAIGLVTLLRNRDPQRARLHRAHAMACSMSQTGHHADAIREYVSAVSGIPTRSITAGDCLRVLHTLRSDHAERLAKIVADDETMRASDVPDSSHPHAIDSNDLRTMLKKVHSLAQEQLRTRTPAGAAA